jgi:hypothetical protein
VHAARWLPRVPPVRSNSEGPGCAEPQWGHCSGTARYQQTVWSSCFPCMAVLDTVYCPLSPTVSGPERRRCCGLGCSGRDRYRWSASAMCKVASIEDVRFSRGGRVGAENGASRVPPIVEPSSDVGGREAAFIGAILGETEPEVPEFRKGRSPPEKGAAQVKLGRCSVRGPSRL